MNVTRTSRFVAIGFAGALALAACGGSSSDSASGDETGGTGSGDIRCVSGTIKASGSSAQKNAITEWINEYQAACPDATIEYTPSGSSAGIQDFINNQTSFAGSDAPLNEEQAGQAATRCQNNPAWNLPMVGGAIAVAYNVEGVDSLTLTPEVTAKIFANEITQWNDPAIAALNSGVNLPDAPIAQYHRSDGSGTTQNFTAWLDQASGGTWTFGDNKEWKAPGGQGSKGNDGVASSLKSTPNSIGYIEESFLEQAGAQAALIDNGGGAVELTSENASNGLATAKVVGEGNDLALELDYTTTDPTAYPVVLITYEITCSVGLPADQLDLTQAFLEYTASPAAQEILPEIGYVPLPAELESKVQTAVQALS
ncbi:MAG: phosphate ABC transporter substrate-binding protein PstS [Actinobacteria bacterium]|nr:phosphate ABC transporter substrate-binding protein PstS [Actinomycetota bacterium]MCB9411651.1 phosphate ABC transporter substrate-binding protein PstS [Actinomycetota bacterium]